MSKKKQPINHQFAAIDSLFWEMLQDSDYYAHTTEVSDIAEIEKDKGTLFESLKDNIGKCVEYSEIEQKVDFYLENMITSAQVCGEEKGFILGFLYAAQLYIEVAAGRGLACAAALERMKNNG